MCSRQYNSTTDKNSTHKTSQSNPGCEKVENPFTYLGINPINLDYLQFKFTLKGFYILGLENPLDIIDPQRLRWREMESRQ